jgi:DNA polymerase III subunit beta
MESLQVVGEYGIGRMARESGLTVSALRFYDGAGVLTPASVDRHTGYRFYAPDQLVVARLVASLRRVGMPLAQIRRVLAARADVAAVDDLLATHLRRLEQGLTDARRELSSVRSLLNEENAMSPTTVTLHGAELADALRAVRFAVGADPDLPVLSGVLLDVTAASVTLVATDRYRLAMSSTPVVALDGPPVSAVVPAALADRIPSAPTVELTIAGPTITVRAGGETLDGALLPDAFPDYRRLLPAAEGARPVPVDAALRTAVATATTRTVAREQDGVECQVTTLRPGPDGISLDAHGDGVGVNREFLLEALDAAGAGQLTLSLDGPVQPLVIRSPRSLSLLMPVRL